MSRYDELCAAYWAAKNHDEEHAVIQRLWVYEDDPGGWGGKPCEEPECVALRAEERRKAGLGNLGLPIARTFFP